MKKVCAQNALPCDHTETKAPVVLSVVQPNYALVEAGVTQIGKYKSLHSIASPFSGFSCFRKWRHGFSFVEPGTEPWALCMLGQCSITEPPPSYPPPLDRASIICSRRTWTHDVTQTGFELVILLPHSLKCLGLLACATSPESPRSIECSILSWVCWKHSLHYFNLII